MVASAVECSGNRSMSARTVFVHQSIHFPVRHNKMKKPSATTIVAVLAVTICATGLVLWNRPPVFLRYHGTQPPLTLALLSTGSDKDSVPQIVKAAKQFYIPPSDYWPEPVNVSECDTFWWVKFKKKEKVIRLNFIEQIETERPGGVCIQVDKRDLSCKLVPAR